MFTRLIYGDGRCRKGRIGERAHGYGDVIRQTGDFPIYRGPAVGAEMKGNLATLISDANELRRATAYDHIVVMKAGLRTKYTTGTALAGKAMADRNSNRFARSDDSHLPTTAGSGSLCHEVKRIVEVDARRLKQPA